MKKKGKRVNIRISEEARVRLIKLADKKQWTIVTVVEELSKCQL